MKTGHQRIAIDLIEMNTGQIAGLPSNPRQWTKAQLDNLKASIEETPELLEARGCIVDYHEGKYVCLGGNMRYAACKALGMSELPCYVVPEGTTLLKKKQLGEHTLMCGDSTSEEDVRKLMGEVVRKVKHSSVRIENPLLALYRGLGFSVFPLTPP